MLTSLMYTVCSVFQIAEILKDRPSWFRDCRSLDVFTMFPVGTGGTIELIYTQVRVIYFFYFTKPLILLNG